LFFACQFHGNNSIPQERQTRNGIEGEGVDSG
jgi:hypothetical protein